MSARRLYDLGYRWLRMPWELGPCAELVASVEGGRLRPGRALDLGCGTGANAGFLAQRGFGVTGVDFAPAALATARQRARAAGLRALSPGEVARRFGAHFAIARVAGDPAPDPRRPAPTGPGAGGQTVSSSRARASCSAARRRRMLSMLPRESGHDTQVGSRPAMTARNPDRPEDPAEERPARGGAAPQPAAPPPLEAPAALPAPAPGRARRTLAPPARPGRGGGPGRQALLLAIQQTAGNRAAQRFLQRAPAARRPGGPGGWATGRRRPPCPPRGRGRWRGAAPAGGAGEAGAGAGGGPGRRAGARRRRGRCPGPRAGRGRLHQRGGHLLPRGRLRPRLPRGAAAPGARGGAHRPAGGGPRRRARRAAA